MISFYVLVFALHSILGAEDEQKEFGAHGELLPCLSNLSMSCCFSKFVGSQIWKCSVCFPCDIAFQKSFTCYITLSPGDQADRFERSESGCTGRVP